MTGHRPLSAALARPLSADLSRAQSAALSLPRSAGRPTSSGLSDTNNETQVFLEVSDRTPASSSDVSPQESPITISPNRAATALPPSATP